MDHTCPATIITCIDFRFWQKLVSYLGTRGVNKYDLVSLAGGAKNLVDEDTRGIVYRQLDICTQKHCIEKVYVVNHIDCGAYGGSGAFGSPEAEREKLVADLESAKKLIQDKYPELEVELLLMNFEGIEVLGKAEIAEA